MAEVTYVGRLVRPEVRDRHWADGLERVVEVHRADGSVQRLSCPRFDSAVDWLGWGPGMGASETACALLENLIGEDITLDLVVDLAETFETLAVDRGWRWVRGLCGDGYASATLSSSSSGRRRGLGDDEWGDHGHRAVWDQGLTVRQRQLRTDQRRRTRLIAGADIVIDEGGADVTIYLGGEGPAGAPSRGLHDGGLHPPGGGPRAGGVRLRGRPAAAQH